VRRERAKAPQRAAVALAYQAHVSCRCAHRARPHLSGLSTEEKKGKEEWGRKNAGLSNRLLKLQNKIKSPYKESNQ